MQETPTHDELRDLIAAGEKAAAASAAARRKLRRRRTPKRRLELEARHQACQEAAMPLRSAIAMCPAHGLPLKAELKMKKVMESLRYERRQLTKMLTP